MMNGFAYMFRTAIVKVMFIRTESVNGPKSLLGKSKIRSYHSPVSGRSMSNAKKNKHKKMVILILICWRFLVFPELKDCTRWLIV